MFFVPYVIRGCDAEKIAVQIVSATQNDLAATKGNPPWQTDWESDYLANPIVDKFAIKLDSGEIIALGAYQITGRKAYVYILYVESAPQSNPTITSSEQREYYGIGEALVSVIPLITAVAGMWYLTQRPMSLHDTTRETLVLSRSRLEPAADRSGLCWLMKMRGTCFRNI